MKKPIGILTARMGSSRVPGKAMMDLAGKPMIGRIIDRMRAVPVVDRSSWPRRRSENEPTGRTPTIGVDVYQHPDEEDMVARIFNAIEDTDAKRPATGGDCPPSSLNCYRRCLRLRWRIPVSTLYRRGSAGPTLSG